ncbi:MAG: hypothetical protein Q9184_002287 [Pyrenodesmia sp. 2 TL-2023]
MSVERKPDRKVLASLKRRAQFLTDDLEQSARISETEASDEELGFDNNPVVTLKVGPKGCRSRYQVHKGLLCHVSPYFKAAFERDFKEASGSITFPEDDSEDWERFIHWLYKRKLQITSLAEPTPLIRYTDLIDLYILADKYDIGLLKNHIMRCLFRTVHHYRNLHSNQGLPCDSLVEHIYNLTPGHSTLRQLTQLSTIQKEL